MKHTEASKRATRLVSYSRIDSARGTTFEGYLRKRLAETFESEDAARTWVAQQRGRLIGDLMGGF